MVGTVKQKLYTTGNGTKLANYQSLMINWVMIQHIILLELTRV